MTTRWESRQSGIGRAGIKAERRTAKALDAKLQPASGARDHSKGDMAWGDFLIEHKSTVRDSLGVKLDWLLKIKGEALRIGKRAALAIDFIRPDGRSQERWIAVPEEVWKELVDGA